MAQKYSEQYNRMKRWCYRIKNPDSRNCDGTLGSLYWDDVCYSFFTCCYHLKDWIKNDDSLERKTKNRVENFVNRSFYLKTCGIICNVSKHLKRDRSTKLNVKIERKGFTHNLFGGSGPIYTTIEYRVNVNGKSYNVIQFAEKCIQEWDRFFEDNGLPIPQKDRTIHFDT